MATISGYYGSQDTPCTIYTYETRNGSTWYVIEGSVNVNRTFDELTDGVQVEHLDDFDTFTASSPIESEDQLEAEIM